MPDPSDRLSKYQRNDVFRAIELSGIPLSEFKLTATTTRRSYGIEPVTAVYHRSSGSALGLTKNLESRRFGRGSYERFEVIEQRGREEFYLDLGDLFMDLPPQRKFRWKQVLRRVQQWASRISREMQEAERYAKAPDLWEELYRGRESLAGNYKETSENTPFTEAEQARISEQIRQVKDYISSAYALSSDQMSRVEDRLDQAEQASRRIGRKDWLLMFNGAVFSLILSDLIPPQAAEHILLLTLHGLGHLFGIGGPTPPLPTAG